MHRLLTDWLIKDMFDIRGGVRHFEDGFLGALPEFLVRAALKHVLTYRFPRSCSKKTPSQMKTREKYLLPEDNQVRETLVPWGDFQSFLAGWYSPTRKEECCSCEVTNHGGRRKHMKGKGWSGGTSHAQWTLRRIKYFKKYSGAIEFWAVMETRSSLRSLRESTILGCRGLTLRLDLVDVGTIHAFSH